MNAFIPRYDKHYGYDGKGYNCLPCVLKSISGSWHLEFSDGHRVDTRCQSTGNSKFTKKNMYDMMKEG